MASLPLMSAVLHQTFVRPVIGVISLVFICSISDAFPLFPKPVTSTTCNSFAPFKNAVLGVLDDICDK